MLRCLLLHHHEAEAHFLFSSVLDRECYSRGDGDVTANDRMAAKKIFGAIEDVHRSAFSFCCAGIFAEQFCEDSFRINSLGNRLAVVSVCRDDVVVRIDAP